MVKAYAREKKEKEHVVKRMEKSTIVYSRRTDATGIVFGLIVQEKGKWCIAFLSPLFVVSRLGSLSCFLVTFAFLISIIDDLVLYEYVPSHVAGRRIHRQHSHAIERWLQSKSGIFGCSATSAGELYAPPQPQP